jgi:hypothetical protein
VLGSTARDLNVGVFIAAALLLGWSAAAGVVLILYSGPGRSRAAAWRIALGTLTAVAMIFTAIGMTVAPAPPSPTAMAASSLVTLAGIWALALWLGKALART